MVPVNNLELNLRQFDQYYLNRKSRKHNEKSRPKNLLPKFFSQTNFTPTRIKIDSNLIQFT